MKTILRVKDNTDIDKTDFVPISNLTKMISGKTLEELKKEGVFVFPENPQNSDDIADDGMILQSTEDKYRTSNVMGFLGVEQERLEIQSRFSTGEQDYFLWYMLEKVLGIPNFLNLDTDLDRENKLYSLFIFMFPHYLKNAFRKGVFKTYIRFHYNNSNVKGSIDIAEHIKKNSPFIGNIAYSQREFSFDNHLMELVRHTIEHIKTKPYGNELLRKVHDEVASVIEVTASYAFHNRRRIIMANKKNLIRHAYFHEYIALQNLCIMILEYEKHQISTGVKHIHGILFDGAWLWEEYINSLICDKYHHPNNRIRENKQQLFTKVTKECNRLVGEIYPDFISKDIENRVIADAKYRPAENIGNRDYLQVLAYMFRFDAKQGFYLYPRKDDDNNETLFLNQGSTFENNVKRRDDLQIVKFGLLVPNSIGDYISFRKAMEESELIFKCNFQV
jgi:5-methylcytosine-specific restriction endonuclease McrBC regulatory subunit McrC